MQDALLKPVILHLSDLTIIFCFRNVDLTATVHQDSAVDEEDAEDFV